MKNANQKFVSTMELANLLGVSRIAVFKKIQNGQIKAKKDGRNYVINVADVPGLNDKLTTSNKKMISRAVSRAICDYGETLRLLAKE